MRFFLTWSYQVLPGLIMTGNEVTEIHLCVPLRHKPNLTQTWQAEDTFLINCWQCHLSPSSLNSHDLLSDQLAREFNLIIFSFETLRVNVGIFLLWQRAELRVLKGFDKWQTLQGNAADWLYCVQLWQVQVRSTFSLQFFLAREPIYFPKDYLIILSAIKTTWMNDVKT